jgi:hypothetical protein
MVRRRQRDVARRDALNTLAKAECEESLETHGLELCRIVEVLNQRAELLGG